MENEEAKIYFEEVYMKYKDAVYLVAYSILKNKEDSEDVAHDVFMAFFQHKDKEKIRNIKNYLLKMSQNKALNFLNKRNKEELVDDFSAVQLAVCSGEKDTTDRSLTKFLEILINELPVTERQIFILHVNGNMKFREISKIMDISVSEAHRRYKKAVNYLKEQLKKGGCI